MADNRKYAKALLDYVQMPMAQLGAVFGTTPQKMSKALRQEGSNVYESMKSAVTAPGRALQGQMNPQMMMDENGNIIQDNSKINQEGMNFALNFMGGGSAPAIGKPTVAGELGIHAYHGSPHVFDKFDLSKARTGHGAEAYGHGAYLSEAVDLAKGFQPRSDAFENAIGKLSEKAYDTNNYTAADIYDNFLIHRTPTEVKSMINEMYQGPEAVKANQALNQATKLYQTKSKGGLYKVDLPDEHLPYFLDWNKPLHEQPKPVYEALMKAGSNVSDNFSKQLLSGAKGEDIYSALINAHQLGKIPGEGSDVAASQVAAANFLNSLGVKGVKYFDKSSPGSGQGVNNYVVHDPEILSILERNDVPLKK
jgi:hypothetical protein